MARTSHERVVLWSSFFDAWLGAIGSERDLVTCDNLQQLIKEAVLFPWLGMIGIECVCPLAEGIDGALETEASEVDGVKCCGSLHETAHKVVCDNMQGDFFTNHLWCAASQDIHTESDLDIAEEQLNAPAAEVQRGEIFARVGDGVSQCGDDDNGLGPKAGAIDLDVKHSQSERLGKRPPLTLGKILGAIFRFGPGDETIFLAQVFALPEVGRSGVMNAHNCINPLGEQFGNRAVGAESTVGKRNVTYVEKVVLPAEKAAFMDMLVALCHVQKRTAGKTEAAHQFSNRKPAPLGLIGVLRPYGLVFFGVGHGNAGAVDDLDMAAQPQLFGADSSFQLLGRMLLDVVQRLKRKTRTRLAIGTRGCTGDRELPGRMPCLDFADDFAARAARRHDLGQKSPEGDCNRIRSSPTIGALCCRFQKSGGRPALTDAGQLTE